MPAISVDLTQYKRFMERLKQAANGDFKKELTNFLESIGLEYLQIIQNEIIRCDAVDTRQMLASFSKSAGDNVWIMDEGGLTLEVGTHVEYAKYVNDGHWTNPKGVATRFVPGVFSGGSFTYSPGAKTGMVLKQQWIEGRHFWESGLRILNKVYPKLIDEMLQDWLDRYFAM